MAIATKETTTKPKKKYSLKADDETLIRDIIDNFSQAIEEKNLDKVMSFYATEVVAFDMMPPLQYKGKKPYKVSWEKGLKIMEEPFKFEFKDLKIFSDEYIAVCFGLNHYTCTEKSGKNIDMWSRWTCSLKKEKGKWQIIHEHYSVPVDMESEKAILNLKPEKVTH